MEKQKNESVFLKSLIIENIRCFKERQTIDFSENEEKPAMWTVILGNNNTGKTTILKVLAGLETYQTDEQENWFFPKLSNPTIKTQYLPWLSANKNKYFITALYLKEGKTFKYKLDAYNKMPQHLALSNFSICKIYAYGATRRMSETNLAENEVDRNNEIENIFTQNDLPNVEEWLLQLFLSEKLGQQKATKLIEQIKNILTSGLLPDVKSIEIKSIEKNNKFENFVEFDTDYGKVRLRDLGYGYQSMMAWVLDLVRRMIERYPDEPKPLQQSAIVLVDEIDLHLHPEWQRKIIAHLTKYFPNTQFIVTAHSPLIVQSAERVNILLLKKKNDHVIIEQPKIKTFRGWTVDEILQDLMDLENRTMSDEYLRLVAAFEEALDTDNSKQAQLVFHELKKILHPQSSHLKMFKIQLTSLSTI